MTRSRFLPKKLTDAELVRKFTLLLNKRFIIMCPTAHQRTLFWARRLQSTSPHPKYPQGFQTKILLHIYYLPCVRMSHTLKGMSYNLCVWTSLILKHSSYDCMIVKCDIKEMPTPQWGQFSLNMLCTGQGTFHNSHTINNGPDMKINVFHVKVSLLKSIIVSKFLYIQEWLNIWSRCQKIFQFNTIQSKTVRVKFEVNDWTYSDVSPHFSPELFKG